MIITTGSRLSTVKVTRSRQTHFPAGYVKRDYRTFMSWKCYHHPFRRSFRYSLSGETLAPWLSLWARPNVATTLIRRCLNPCWAVLLFRPTNTDLIRAFAPKVPLVLTSPGCTYVNFANYDVKRRSYETFKTYKSSGFHGHKNDHLTYDKCEK